MVIPNFFLSTAPSGSSSGTVVTRAVINISSDSDPLPTVPTTDQSFVSSSGFSESFYSESADSSAGFMRKPQGRELKLGGI